ncbi:MAG TPA: outer membrane lipoprotein-sorting protein [Magnetospirillum sp.]|nr:outer membrane lipoprotein-sorting protein [Magnetospirillum sp.]
MSDASPHPPARVLRRVLAMVAVLMCGQLSLPAMAASPTAQEMLEAADRVRNPGRPFRLTNTLVEYVEGQPQGRTELLIFAKLDSDTGQFKNLIRFLAPPRDRGKLMLMENSRLWFYDGASKASVRLSLQQRLMGQSSNGDVLTVNLAKDYSGTLVGEETIKDSARSDRDCWHLNLTAISESAVYNRIEYWVERETYNPIKGIYYSDSGRMLKLVFFRKYQMQLGNVRPTETVIIDAIDPKQVTIMTFTDYRFQDIPEAWFQRDFLPHLEAE